MAQETRDEEAGGEVSGPLCIVYEKMIGTVEGIKNMGSLEKSLLSLSFFLEYLS